MPNNVDKYKDSNRWYNRTLEERHQYVVKCFELKKEDFFDDDDLQYVLKDAMVGGVYFSECAMKMVMNEKDKIHPLRVRPLINKIYKEGCFKILREDGSLCCEGLLVDDFFRQSSFSEKLRFEHVIPYKVFSDELERLYNENKLDRDAFRMFMLSISICIVLKSEDLKLDASYRSCMPTGWKWEDSPFARYERIGIKIWKGEDR